MLGGSPVKEQFLNKKIFLDLSEWMMQVQEIRGVYQHHEDSDEGIPHGLVQEKMGHIN